MHIQALFATPEQAACHALMRRYPLASLFVPDAQGGQAHLLPLELRGEGEHGLLCGHVGRRHSLCDSPAQGQSVLLVFQGPNAYISPRWYVNGQRSGKVAPSWNFIAVQARGQLRWVDDRDWLRTHLAALTHAQEAQRAQPWRLSDADPAFIDSMAEQLIGFEIALTALEGKRFLSQQRTPADRLSLISHLQAEGSGMARDVAGLIEP